MNWLQSELKMAGWRDWFTVPEEARQNMERLGRENALNSAINALRGYEQEPEVASIIQQIKTLMQK